MSFRVTIACNRAQGEAIAELDDPLPNAVLVADEPDASKPDEWLIHAYFEHPPGGDELKTLMSLGSGEPRIEELGEADWVTMSQSGLQPIRAGRFYVHTPTVRTIPPGTIPFEIDASLAFGTGQHATTSGCLEALDRLVVPIDDESDQVRPHGHNPTEARNASTPGADNGSLKRTRSSGASSSSLRSVSEGRGRPRHVERHGVRVWMPSRARSTGPGSRASVMPRISSGPAVILSPSRAVTRRRSYLVPS